MVLVRYIVVGLVANLLGLAAFQFLVWAGAVPELASFLAFFPAFFCAYLLNKVWSFSSVQRHRVALIRYSLATAIVVFLQICIVAVSYRLFGLLPVLSQIIALVIATPISYFLLSRWVFSARYLRYWA